MSTVKRQFDLLREAGVSIMKMLDSGVPRRDALENAARTMVSKDPQMKTFAFRGMGFIPAWAESSFATVIPSPKLTASLMATSIPEEVADSLRLPWRCFSIVLPDGLFPSGSPSRLLVLRTSISEEVAIISVGTKIIMMGTEKSLGGWAQTEFVEENDAMAALPEPEKKAFKNMETLIGRLVVGVCAEMNEPRLSKQAQRISNGPIKRKRGKPISWNLALGRPVKLDVRESIRRFARGLSSKLTTQFLTRGHWKRQRYGPRNSLLKMIHIEPYWKGPEDALILIRPHLIGQ